MAQITDNTVPLGQAGTGAAYILPQGSQAVDRFLETQDYNTKIAQENADNKAKQAALQKAADLKAAQAQAQSYKENAFKAKNGTLFNNELLGLQQKHIQQGSQYAQQGIDIYNPNPNDPEQMAAHDQYMSDRAKLYDMQDVRDDLSKHLIQQDETASKAAPGEYDPDSIADLHNFYQKNTLSDIVNKGLQAPSIQQQFDPEKNVLSKVEPIMSPETEYVKNAHKITSTQFKPKETGANVVNMYSSAPGGDKYIQKQTGLSIADARQLPDDLPTITDFNDHQFRNTPQGQKALVDAGITSYSDPKYDQLLQQKSAADFQAKQKFNSIVQQGVDRARAKAKIVNKDVPDFTYEDQQFKRNAENRAQSTFDDKNDGGEVVFGNGESTVPVLKTTSVNGKIVPQKVGVNAKGKDVMANSYTEPEQGATLFSQAFPQQKLTATPGTMVDLKTGHSIKNTTPFEVTAGSVKMEPVFAGLDGKDSRNGAVMSKRQLQEIISGNSKVGDMNNLSFQPMVYGTRPVKNAQGKVEYQPVAFPYDAVRGNSKLKTGKFDETETQFKQMINSSDFKALNAQERADFLFKTFNIK